MVLSSTKGRAYAFSVRSTGTDLDQRSKKKNMRNQPQALAPYLGTVKKQWSWRVVLPTKQAIQTARAAYNTSQWRCTQRVNVGRTSLVELLTAVKFDMLMGCDEYFSSKNEVIFFILFQCMKKKSSYVLM